MLFLFYFLDQNVFRSSATGVEEALIVQFGQRWMKTTTNALAEKEDENPNEVWLRKKGHIYVKLPCSLCFYLSFSFINFFQRRPHFLNQYNNCFSSNPVTQGFSRLLKHIVNQKANHIVQMMSLQNFNT